MHARGVGPRGQVQLFRTVPPAQGQDQLLAGGLVNFIDARIAEPAGEFFAQAVQQRSVQSHADHVFLSREIYRPETAR